MTMSARFVRMQPPPLPPNSPTIGGDLGSMGFGRCGGRTIVGVVGMREGVLAAYF